MAATSAASSPKLSSDSSIINPPKEPSATLKDPPPQCSDEKSAPKDPPPAETTTLKDPPASETPTLKDPPSEDPPSLKDPPKDTQSPTIAPSKPQTTPLTYTSSKNSESYLTAKSLLTTGEFESALTTLSTAIATTLSLLPESEETHPSLAPLYYLYGTTLLYSVEESSNPQDNAVMQQSDDDDAVNDIQIAWENLESARSIVEKMSTADTELRLDLAQIHVRLGDLQRINGNYEESVADYGTCLAVRRELLGEFDRRVADCHYNLGLAYLMLAADGDKSGATTATTVTGSGPPVAAAASGGDTSTAIDDARTKECKETSLIHYLSCGRGFAGLIASLCGADRLEIAGPAPEDNSDKKVSSDKTEECDSASVTLQAVRDRVAALKATDDADADTVHEWRELLDEIQETIDASEESVRVLKDVSQLKKQAEADIEAADVAALKNGLTASLSALKGGEEDGKKMAAVATGPTTTIGFGGASGAAVAAAVAPVVNMMVVKKKKKKRDSTESLPSPAPTTGETEDSNSEPLSKRYKSAE